MRTLSGLITGLILLLSMTMARASATIAGDLACNDLVQVSLDEDCHSIIHPDMVLEGSYPNYDIFRVTVLDGNQAVGNFVDARHIHRTLTVRVTDTLSGNSCWGSLLVEDKSGPVFNCPADPLIVDCTVDTDTLSPPYFSDNCDPNPTVQLIWEEHAGLGCATFGITRVYRAEDAWGNQSATCTLEIRIIQADFDFPEDMTWTCEQYAAFPNIITTADVHPLLKQYARELDSLEYCCIPGLGGNNNPNRIPFQAGVEWWLDSEDFDVPLDPNYDDDVDNPLTDPNRFQCGTPSPETDTDEQTANISVFHGCPYTTDCTTYIGHDSTIISVPLLDTTGLLRGLEDADILSLTGSGAPNVYGKQHCQYAVTYRDQKLESCPGADTNVVFKIIRTWTILDWCTGNAYTDVQVIKVVDKKVPEIFFGDDYQDVLISNEQASGVHGPCGANGLLDVPTITDNCVGIKEVRVFTPVGLGIPVFDNGELIGFSIPSPYLFRGQHQITYEVEDYCGNIATSRTKVEVIDGLPPTPVCREITQVALSNEPGGLTPVKAIEFDEGSHDNCGNVYFKVLKMEEGTCNNANRDKGNESREYFDDEVIFCCDDIQFDQDGEQLPVNIILRVYDQFPGLGAIPTQRGGQNDLIHFGSAVSLNDQHYNDCMIQVYVEDKLRPGCTPPANVEITCLELPDNLDLTDTDTLRSLFGTATAFDNCSAQTEELSPSIHLDQCGVGSIVRRFRAVDQGGNVSLARCEQTITVKAETYYELDIPGDFEDECSVADPDTLVRRNLGCDLLAVSVEDDLYDASQLGDGACYKIIRTYQIINWCEYDGFSDPMNLPRLDLNNNGQVGDGYTPSHPTSRFRAPYRVVSDGQNLYFGSLNGNVLIPSTGYFQYRQHIKIYDDTPPELFPPDLLQFCGGELDEDPCTGEVDVYPIIDEACTPDATFAFWQLDEFDNGTYERNGLGRLQQRLPLGDHRVRFTIADDCGNTNEIDLYFSVIDCKRPSPVCVNGLSVDLMADGSVPVWASDFDGSSFDYCNDFEFTINRITDQDGDGVITPDDYQVDPPTDASVEFTCDHLGIQYVQMWVHELSGDGVEDWDYCVTFVEVQDNFDHCNNPRPSIGGQISKEDGESVADVTVELSGQHQRSAITGNDGSFLFEDLTADYDYSVTPSRDDDPLNGVSTFDLVLISKHILNVERLDSPYKIIAADANNSGSVTTFDLVVLRKMILRVDTRFPNNTSWRFVDKRHAFRDAFNPWADALPEIRNVNNLQAGSLTADFIAVKVGDVNGNAVGNDLARVDDRSFFGSLEIPVSDRKLQTGELVEVPFVVDRPVLGYQFTLEFDTDLLELVDWQEGIAGQGHLNVLTREGRITASWNQAFADQSVGRHFTLTFRALSNGALLNALELNSTLTRAEAYDPDGRMLSVDLRTENDAEGVGLTLTNYPNPFRDRTEIAFFLPQPCQTELVISDANGRVVRTIRAFRESGVHSLSVTNQELGAAGMYFYELLTPEATRSGRMLLLD